MYPVLDEHEHDAVRALDVRRRMRPAAESPSAFSVHGSLFLVQVAFASLSVAGRIVLRDMPPLALTAIRLVGAALVFWLLPTARSRFSVPVRDRWGIAGCALLGIFGNQALFLIGLRSTTATHATLLVATIPIFTLLATVLLENERVRPMAILGITLAFSGIAYLVGTEGMALGGETVVGDLFVVGNALVYGFYLVLVRPYVARHGSTLVVSWGFLSGALYAIPFVILAPLVVPELGSVDAVLDVPRATWLLVAYVVAVPTVFTYLTNAWALRFASSTAVSVWIYAQPTVAALLAWFFLDEVPTVRLVGAAILVFAGIGLVARGRAASPLVPSRDTSAPAKER